MGTISSSSLQLWMIVTPSEGAPRDKTSLAGSWPRTTLLVAALRDLSRNQKRTRRTGAIKNGTPNSMAISGYMSCTQLTSFAPCGFAATIPTKEIIGGSVLAMMISPCLAGDKAHRQDEK